MSEANYIRNLLESIGNTNDPNYYQPGDWNITDIIFKTWNSVYPDVDIYISGANDEAITIETNPDAKWYYQQQRSGGEADFILVLYINDEMALSDTDVGEPHIYVEVAAAGGYKGVVGKIISNISNITGIKQLDIDDDTTGGYWKTLANKLGMEYSNNTATDRRI